MIHSSAYVTGNSNSSADAGKSVRPLEERLETYHRTLQGEPSNNLYEVVKRVAAWVRKLPSGHRDIFEREVIPKYLEKEDNSYAVMLCGEAGIESSASALNDMLRKNLASDPGSYINPHLVMSLGALKHQPAYEHIETFIGTEHTLLALESLSRIDFGRSVKHLNNVFGAAKLSSSNEKDLARGLASIFTTLLYDVGPQKVLDLLCESADCITIDPFFARNAFEAAFDNYTDRRDRRVVFPKRARYYIKQVPRILQGTQLGKKARRYWK